MRSKNVKSVETLKANPWLVIQREIRTPMAASFARRSGPVQTPVSPSTRPASTPQSGGRPNQHFFEIADVPMHIAPIGTQVENRIAHHLSRSVVGDVSAAPGLVNLDAAGCQDVGAGPDVRSPAVALHAERQHMRMLDEQQDVVNPAGPPLLDELTLQRQGVGVGNESQPTHI